MAVPSGRVLYTETAAGWMACRVYTLFILALLILPINAFIVTPFLLSSVYPDPTTAMPSAVDAAMLILPP